MRNAEGRKQDFEKKELEKTKGKRKAEEDGDQDDRFVNQGPSSSSAPAVVDPAVAHGLGDPVRVVKRKAEDYPEGEEARVIAEVVGEIGSVGV